MTSDQQSLIDSSKAISQNLFDNFISHLTGGLIPDIETGIIAVVSLTVLYMTFDLILSCVFHFDISEELDYREYRNKRSRSDRFRKRYESDMNPPKTAPKKVPLITIKNHLCCLVVLIITNNELTGLSVFT